MRAPLLLVAALLTSALLPGAAALLGVSTTTKEPVAVVGTEVAGVTASVVLGGDVLVGYEEGKRDAVLVGVRLAGGSVKHVDEGLRLAHVEAEDVNLLTATLDATPGVEFVDANGRIAFSGAQWNGAQWNGAQWNGAQWNGAQWNGAQWNGAQWNGAEAEGAQWNAETGAPAGVDDPGRVRQWALESANVPPAWNASMGERRADLCVLDSGIDASHPDLKPNLWKGPNGTHGINLLDRAKAPDDDAGHGTHMAGIAAGAVGNGWGIAGVGNVRLMSVKILDAEGRGTEADLAWGLAWCARNGADVALMALSASEPGPALDRAIEFAVAKDVVLVASVGNAGACGGCVSFPARHPAVIAVSATDQAEGRASFSSQGKQVEITAPGVDVLSTFVGGAFAYGGGTSQAAAHVAGAAALVRDGHPEMDATQARSVLRASAHDLGPAGRDASYGFGLLDVGAAQAMASGG